MEKYGLLFTMKYTKHPAHAISDSRCNVTCSAGEQQHRSCRVMFAMSCMNFLKLSVKKLLLKDPKFLDPRSCIYDKIPKNLDPPKNLLKLS